MPIILAEHKLAYFPVPKIACTSFKHVFYEIEHGEPFDREFETNKRKGIHATYPAMHFDRIDLAEIQEFDRFAIVRDPVKRLLSCYANRVVHHKELSAHRMMPNNKEFGLKPNPSLDEFIDNLTLYRKVSYNVRHHTKPICIFLGDEPAYFSKIFPIEKTQDFFDHIKSLVRSNTLELGRYQTAGPKLKVEDLTSTQIKNIKNQYAKDYDIFGTYF